MVFGISDAVEFKTAFDKQFGGGLHFHDSCGGQSFSLDVANAKIKDFIESYFDGKNIKVVFSGDGLSFVLL